MKTLEKWENRKILVAMRVPPQIPRFCLITHNVSVPLKRVRLARAVLVFDPEPKTRLETARFLARRPSLVCSYSAQVAKLVRTVTKKMVKLGFLLMYWCLDDL